MRLLAPTFKYSRRCSLDSSVGKTPVKLLEGMFKTRRNVRFPRCGAMVPWRARAGRFRAVTRRCLAPQETPIHRQMGV